MRCGDIKPAEDFDGKSRTCIPCVKDDIDDRKRRRVWNREDRGFASRLNRGFEIMDGDGENDTDND